MALTCPQCATALREVKAEATIGYLVLLDQCPRCGGIWCDRWELYPVTTAAAERIDVVDQHALSQPTPPAAESLTCPRCRARLRRFQDPALPADARVERCLNCDGMWLNRGALRSFKNHNPTAPPATAAELDRLATSIRQDPTSWPAVRNIGAALDDPPPDAEEPSDVGAEIVTSAAWLIARAALRLLLHV